MKAKHLIISGHVQGVGYRAWMLRTARAMGLDGWVRNRADGTVEAWLEGPPEAVAAVEAFCGTGPSEARVERVERESVQAEGAEGFRVR